MENEKNMTPPENGENIKDVLVEGLNEEQVDDNLSNLNWFGQMKWKLKEKLEGEKANKKRHKMVSYSKYGYIFLIPFFLIFAVFSFYPLIQTIVFSFTKYYYSNGGITKVGPEFNGFDNYYYLLFDKENNVFTFKYFGNTLLIWICGFIPQIIASLLLAIWFTDARLKLKFSGFFKAVMYMPNLVMASAFGMLFLMLFSLTGPINQMLEAAGASPVKFLESAGWTRGIIAFINWLMWFGNTTILLMSGIMGIDESIFESARLDGSSGTKTFWHITFPLLLPIFVYVLITSLIGGIQLFDVAQIFTASKGGPNQSAMTIMMYLYRLITSSKNYGVAGAVSVILFVMTSILSIIIFKVMIPTNNVVKQEARAYRARMRWLKNAQVSEPVTEGGNDHE